jgi:hypothetical protein
MAFSTSPSEKCDFRMTFIFGGLQPPKMAALPSAARSLPKNRVFQQAANGWRSVRKLLQLPPSTLH